MKLQLPQHIDKKQWVDRLGVRSNPDEQLMERLEAAERKLMDAAAPHGIYRLMEPDDSLLSGNAIKKHLAECNSMVIMAVTLGAGVDRLIRTAQIRDMAEAVLLDSGASILAEQCADILEELIHAEVGGSVQGDCNASKPEKTMQTYFTGRYSPGYGDFPIEMQGSLIKAVDGPKTIGLTTNERHILIPRKSITAIIGTADHPVTGYLATCDECLIKESCGLRKEGKQCWT